ARRGRAVRSPSGRGAAARAPFLHPRRRGRSRDAPRAGAREARLRLSRGTLREIPPRAWATWYRAAPRNCTDIFGGTPHGSGGDGGEEGAERGARTVGLPGRTPAGERRRDRAVPERPRAHVEDRHRVRRRGAGGSRGPG